MKRDVRVCVAVNMRQQSLFAYATLTRLRCDTRTQVRAHSVLGKYAACTRVNYIGQMRGNKLCRSRILALRVGSMCVLGTQSRRASCDM